MNAGSARSSDATARTSRSAFTVPASGMAEEDLHRHEAFARSVLDAIGANVAVLDRHGVILAVNGAWQQFARDNGDASGGSATGVDVDYLAVAQAAQGPSSEGAAEALTGIRDVLAGRRPSFTIEYPCHSPDEQRWFMLQATPLAGDAEGVVLAHINITARKQAERDVQASTAEMRRLLTTATHSRQVLLSLMEDHRREEEMRAGLQAQLVQAQKLESIGTLAGGVAHEINNPIMGIMGYAQLILDKLGSDSPVAEYATEISKEAERVATIVKNLLSFAREEKPTYSPARLHDIVEDTLSLIRAVMRHDQVTLEIDVPADLPLIRCRSQQIRQVVMNLLTNARDALNDKYPKHNANKKIIVTAREVVIGEPSAVAGKDKHRLRLTVEDHGGGIPEELRVRIFDPFFSTKSRDKGTGLGLSISHSIVKDHGGTLSVESEAGQWTRFHVELPVGDAGRLALES